MRAEIERLKERNKEKDVLLETLSTSQDIQTCKALIQRLKQGNKSRENILRASDTAPPSDCKPRVSFSTERAGLDEGEFICPYCFGRLKLLTTRRSLSGDGNALTEATETLATPISTLLPISEVAAHPQDTWTRMGLTKAYGRQLFDALATWDYLPFCLLCKDPFLQGYYSGSNQYCSSALVNALLALATRVVIEGNDDASVLPSQSFGSKQFFDDAKAAVQIGGSPSALPDIQALGILSLYQISCGREGEAKELAENFACGITNLCLQEPIKGDNDRLYAKVRAATYCGAVSLARYGFRALFPNGYRKLIIQYSIIQIATAQSYDISTQMLEKDFISLDRSLCSIESTSEWDGSLRSSKYRAD